MKRKLEIETKTRVFDGYTKIDEYSYRHSLFQGGMSELQSREVMERGHFVAVLLYDPHLDELVLTEQFRMGAHSALQTGLFPEATEPWLLEVAAGVIDEGETPEAAVHREAREETGCEIKTLEKIMTTIMSPGSFSETAVLYCGHIDASSVGGVHGLEDEGENINVFTVKSEEAFAMVADGRIVCGTTALCLQWLQINKADLHSRWRADGP